MNLPHSHLKDIFYPRQLMAGSGHFSVFGIETLYQYLSLAKGEKNVAETLGGRQLNPDTATKEERRLLNVVEQMAIASDISTPMI